MGTKIPSGRMGRDLAGPGAGPPSAGPAINEGQGVGFEPGKHREEPANDRIDLGKVSRRGALSLAALTSLAACGSNTPEPTPVAGTAPGTTPPQIFAAPTTSPTAAPSASASPSPSASKSAETKKPESEPSKTTKRAKGSSAWGGAVPATPGKVMWGSWLALSGKSLKQSLAYRKDQLGRDHRIVHRFYPWSGYIPSSEPIGKDQILMASWHGAKYSGILNGSADGNIRSVAKKLKGMKRPILLRYGWEMNGNWFEWGGPKNGNNPAGFVQCWKRIHDIFDEVGATNIAWVWSPNWNSGPNVSWNKMQKYYPGDDYVDWVGVSGYNLYKESPSTLFSPVTKAYGSKKPIIFTETAAIDFGSGSKAAWIKKMHSWVEANKAVGGVVWFDTDTQPGVEHNFRPDTESSALAAYKTMVNSSRFQG